MKTSLNIALIILSTALITAILLQTRGGGLGSLFGGEMSGGMYKTRRGLEKTLFQVTIGLSVAFFVLVIINVFVVGS
ncbi:MAG TPA: preprotein translocase subunit SecG [Chloroflexi bacterium]|nr:preprotein translocase subunit SecG [Chloroflexota bacterium]